MPSEFKTRKRIEFADTDCAGIAHFAVFFRYMEEAEHEFLRSCGLSVRTPAGDGAVIGFPRLSARCEFVRSVTFEDVVDVDLWVSRLGRKTIQYSCVFSHGDEVVARGEVVVIACRVRESEGRSIESIPLPDRFRETLEVADRPPLELRDSTRGGSP